MLRGGGIHLIAKTGAAAAESRRQTPTLFTPRLCAVTAFVARHRLRPDLYVQLMPSDEYLLNLIFHNLRSAKFLSS